MTTPPDSNKRPYDKLLNQYSRKSYIDDANELLAWDQEVMMPDEGTPARSKQRGALSAQSHELLVDDQMGEWLSSIESNALDPSQTAVVREIRRQYERQAKVPSSLIQEISETTSDAHPIWQKAVEDDDYEHFAPTLETLLNLKREYASEIDSTADPYEVLFVDFEPYVDLTKAIDILESLRDQLVPLIDEIRVADKNLAVIDGTFSTQSQRSVAETVLSSLGYDFGRGRLDTAPHPFSSGTPFDARVTTRFDESDPIDSLSSTIHEFGHATYTLGLPTAWYGTPLGEHRGLVVHESQSRLWENHIGRSQEFWNYFASPFNEQHGTTYSPTEIYEAANTVQEDNCIRVEADELTYHLHIILRFEIERDLLRDKIDVEEVPAIWNDKMESYLGVRPDTVGEGCLQDIHWSHGSFGYFPTYSLGSVLAAQLFAAAKDEMPNLFENIKTGDFDPLHDWLGEAIHQHGSRFQTDDLIKQATGEELSAEYFVSYASKKFGSLYDLSV